MEEKETAKTDKPELLPAKLRARMLESQDSMFFNVALFEHAQRVAEIFARSTMVPEQFQKNLGNCLIALNYAVRIKADPFMTMQLMHVIHGRPGIEGKLVKALIEQSGKYKDIDYEWLDAEDNPIKKHVVVNNSTKDARGCLLFGTDTKTGKLIKGPKISWKIVHEEGWYEKKGSKWKTIPELMFMYRSGSWFANVHCPEVKLGMHTVEEIKDFIDLEAGANGVHRVKEKTEDRLSNLKERLGEDDTATPSAESTEKEFEALTSVPLSTFKGLRDTGIEQFIGNHNDKIVNKEWPEEILAIVRKKLATKPKWEELLKFPPTEAPTPEDEGKAIDPVKVALNALEKYADWENLGLVGCPRLDGNNAPATKCQFDADGKPKPCDMKIDAEGVVCPGLAAKLVPPTKEAEKGEVLS